MKDNWFYWNLSFLKQKAGIIEVDAHISNSVKLPFAYQVKPETVGQWSAGGAAEFLFNI